MSKIKAFNIKIWLAGNEHTWRLISIFEKQTLQSLYTVIRREFKLYGDHLYCFFIGEKPYNKKAAFGSNNADTKNKAAQTRLGALSLKKGDKLSFVFDFATDDYYVIAIQQRLKVSDKSKFPLVVKRKGMVRNVPPEKKEDLEGNTAKLMKDLVPMLSNAVHSWSKNKQPTKKSLTRDFDLAKKLHKRIKNDWVKINHLENHIKDDLSGWLVALPEALNSEGFSKESLELIDLFMQMEPHSFASDKPIVLLSTGKEVEAAKAVQDNTKQFPDDPWIWTKGADVLWRLNKKRDAEQYYREALDKAGKRRYIRDPVLERLLALLEETGNHKAAEELATAEEKRRAKPDK